MDDVWPTNERKQLRESVKSSAFLLFRHFVERFLADFDIDCLIITNLLNQLFVHTSCIDPLFITLHLLLFCITF